MNPIQKHLEESEKLFDEQFVKIKFWQLVPDTPRMIMASDKNVAVMMANLKSFLKQRELALVERIRESVKELNNDKIPYQSLLFQDCPNCGQEVNRKWVERKCKEIYNQALSDTEQLLNNNKE